MNNSVCLSSSSCMTAAAQMFSNLAQNHTNIDPCTNFDWFVCGGFDERYGLAQHKPPFSTFDITSDFNNATSLDGLSWDYPSDSNHSAYSPMKLGKEALAADRANFNMMQDAYNACLNETAIQKLGVQPLVSLVEHVTKSFDIRNKHDVNGGNSPHSVPGLSKTILVLERLGVSTFEQLQLGVDPHDEKAKYIQARSAGLTLDKLAYTDPDTMERYQSTIEKVFSKLLPGSRAQESGLLSHAVVKLETDILRSGGATIDESWSLPTHTLVQEVGRLKGWGEALQLGQVVEDLAHRRAIQDTIQLQLENPLYLSAISKILATTRTSAIEAYLTWRVIMTYYSFVDGKEVEPISRFLETLPGNKPAVEKQNRELFCLDIVERQVGWILSRFFLEWAFSGNEKEIGQAITTAVKQQFSSHIRRMNSINVADRGKAISKLNLMEMEIQYPTENPNITDPSALEAYYKGLNLTDSYFSNALSYNVFEIDKAWSSLNRPSFREQWPLSTTRAYSHYSYIGNEVVLPASIMQPPFLHADLPSYCNYGAFGALAGHEMAHAFDNRGRHYNEPGDPSEIFSSQTATNLSKLKDCFKQQYSKFALRGPHGALLYVRPNTADGNIADAAGLTIAFEAWKRSSHAADNFDLPGLEHFTHDQLFFIAWGQMWCSKEGRETADMRIREDNAPPRFRILGTTANSEAFRRAFSCPVKNPTCELW
ncbi:hypothetical protein SCAR479_13927 [Seiridium cardinale]|uniref:Uncharacterized protein n=1 Tax=Seiridium cardinale TaxID=138064 RepID=A0ABR2X6I8_9PEZI